MVSAGTSGRGLDVFAGERKEPVEFGRVTNQ